MHRWSQMGRFPGIVAAALLTLAAMPPVVATESPDAVPSDLQRVVDRLGEEARSFDGGALWGISVIDLSTGEEAHFEGDQWVKAASVLKPTWLAAAVRAEGVAAAAPWAESVMVWSNNESAGRVIALAGGLDAVNAFTSGLGMNGTLVVEWTFGINQRASAWPGEHPWLNYTTTEDLAIFWRLLYEGWVLDARGTAAMLEWGRLEKPDGSYEALVARLPEEISSRVAYKVGRLPPGRDLEEFEGSPDQVPPEFRDTIIGGGVVELPGGSAYAVSIGGFGGWSWPGKVGFVEYASCRIYEVISGEELECDGSSDPRHTRLDTDPPAGGLAEVSGGPEFITARGWASDPDDPLGAIRVRFRIDGHWSRMTRSDARHSWGGDPVVVADGHGFEVTLLALLARGDHEVCAFAINDGAGSDTAIGCETLTIR